MTKTITTPLNVNITQSLQVEILELVEGDEDHTLESFVEEALDFFIDNLPWDIMKEDCTCGRLPN